MREIPLLLNGPMVRATLADIKTVTRRLPTMLLGFGQVTDLQASDTRGYDWAFRDKRGRWNEISHERLLAACPYGQPGDRLWVRETWQAIRTSIDPETGYGDGVRYSHDIPQAATGYWTVAYAADPIHEASREDRGFPWRPAIHMPRWASRNTLEVTGVRVERLQDVSEEQARAEGASFHAWRGTGHSGWRHDLGDVHANARSSFARLWESINGAGSWDANPWVWCVSFKRIF